MFERSITFERVHWLNQNFGFFIQKYFSVKSPQFPRVSYSHMIRRRISARLKWTPLVLNLLPRMHNSYSFAPNFLLLLTLCLLLLPLWDTVIVLCFVVRYFMSILVLQSSWWGRESWLLCLICLPGVSWCLSGSSSRCHGVVCSLWSWYFLIILTYNFWQKLQGHIALVLSVHLSIRQSQQIFRQRFEIS